MSAIISCTCPYCSHDTGGFDVVAEHLVCTEPNGDRLFQALAVCGKCKKAAVIVLVSPHGALSPMEHSGDYRISYKGARVPLKLIDIEPKPVVKIPPKHLPDDVERALKQAYSNTRADHWEVAMLMTRKALERAVKHVDPEGRSTQTLGQRIERLGKQGLIPPAMVDWAFEVTHIGNDAAHEDCISETDEEVEDIKQAIAFAEMLFTYTFTMPEEVRTRRERRKK